MEKELQNKLIERFPALFSSLKWGIQVRNGWFQLLWNLSEKLEPLCNDEYKILQIKNKFGTLRIYAFASEEMKRLINDAQTLSEAICEICGATVEQYNKENCELHKLLERNVSG